MSQIRIVYIDRKDKRGSGSSVVSSTGAWGAVISEAAHMLDPSDEDSFAARYKQTTVEIFYVYFGAGLATKARFSF